METIKSYIENLFASLPITPEIKKMKEELLQNMEDKYRGEKDNGRSENEAIGIVISEFGNIDELLDEMGIIRDLSDEASMESNYRELDNKEIEEFITNIRFYGKMIGLGVMMCILSPSIILAFGSFSSLKSYGSMAPALFVIAIGIAVTLFIVFGLKFSRYKFIEEGEFRISPQKKKDLEARHKELSNKFAFSIAFSVLLIFAGVTSTIILTNKTTEDVAAISLLTLVGIAVYNIIRSTFYVKPFDKLLKRDQTFKDRKTDKKVGIVLGAVAGLVFPLAAALYLLLSFTTDRWDITWIIYPIVAICYGAFASFYVLMKKKNDI